MSGDLKSTVVFIAMGIMLLLAYTRITGLEGRLSLLELSLAQSSVRQSQPIAAPLNRKDNDVLAKMCRTLRGAFTESSLGPYCDLSPVAAAWITAASSRSSERMPSSNMKGEGVEVHYADRSKRKCIETTGEAKCDPATLAVRCPAGAQLVRVAPTPDGQGFRNRYVCR